MGYIDSLTLKKIWLIAFVLIFIPVNTAIAERYTFETKLNIRGEYSDNIAFEKNNPRDDIYLNVGPSITYKYLTERFDFNSRASFNLIRYSQETDEDRENQYYYIRGRYKFAERLTFNGDVSYRRDTTQETELLETGEVTARQNRDQYIGGGGLTWQFSEVSRTSLYYTYLKKEFEDENSVGYDRHSISLAFNRYVNNGKDVFSITPAYTLKSSEFSDLHNYVLSLGWRHNFSETFSFSTSAGGRYTEKEFDDGIMLDDKGYIADVSIVRETETVTSEFRYSRNLYTNVGGGETEVDQFSLNFDRQLLHRLRVGISGRYYLRRLPGGLSGNERTYYQVSPTLSYRLTEKQNLELGYRWYSSQDDSLAGDEWTLDRNTVWLMLRLDYDKRW